MTIDHQSSTGNPAGAAARTIPIDTEHFTVRFLVPVVSIGLAIAFYILGTDVLSDALHNEGVTPGCVLAPGALVVFFLGAYVVEATLKRLLPGRRAATLDSESLRVTDRRSNSPATVTIDWHKTVNVQAWRFEVKRRSRVPKGWYCVALHLLQDEEDLVLYTFMSRDHAEDLVGYENFTRLRPRKETEASSDLSAIAQQRRLLKLEDKRWNDGAEIAADDFRAVLDAVEKAVPGWR